MATLCPVKSIFTPEWGTTGKISWVIDKNKEPNGCRWWQNKIQKQAPALWSLHKCCPMCNVCVCVTHEKASVAQIALSLDTIAHTHHISQCNASCPGFLKRPLRCYKVAFASELISSHVYTATHPPKCHFRKLMPTIMGKYAARTSTPKVPSFIQVTNPVPEMPPLMWSRNWMTHEKWCHSSAAGGQDTAAKSKGWSLLKETSGDMSFDPGIWVTGMKIPLCPNHMPLNHSKSLLLKSCWNIAGETTGLQLD